MKPAICKQGLDLARALRGNDNSLSSNDRVNELGPPCKRQRSDSDHSPSFGADGRLKMAGNVAANLRLFNLDAE